MKKWKKLIIVLLVFGVVSVGSLSWYAARYSMEPAAEFEVNSDTLQTRVLIATQGSEFKNNVVAMVIDSLKTNPIHFRIIDVKFLDAVSESDWNAIVILHTWEYSSPPESVQKFVSSTSEPGNLIVVTTSGSGATMEGVDAISSASKADERKQIVQELIRRIKDKTK